MTDEPVEDLLNKEFDQWTVIEYAGKNRRGKSVVDLWKCRCSCGAECIIYRYNLINGYSTQCRECAIKSQKKSELHKLYRIERNKLKIRWSKDILVSCIDEWKDFDLFYQWAVVRKWQGNHFNRRITLEPHGPKNTFISNVLDSTRYFIDMVVGYYVSKGMVLSDAIKRGNSISKQRRMQIVNVLCGLCGCGNVLKHSYKSCERCWRATKERNYANRKSGRIVVE